MVIIGAYGGAICFGVYCSSTLRWGHQETFGTDQVKLWNFFMGASLRCDSGRPAEDCNTSVINARTFLMTSGAQLAVSITRHKVRASSFPAGKINVWKSWCQEATIVHQRVVEEIAQRQTGPFYDPSVGTWHFNCDGTYWVSAPPLPSPP